MNEDNINEWVGNARANENVAAAPKGVKVIRKEQPKSHGTIIMEIAEKLRPSLMKWFDGKYNDDGMLIQPAHVRGFAIEMAENLVKSRHHNDNKASA